MQEREIHCFSQISEEEIKLCLIDHTSRQWRRDKYLNFFVQCLAYRLLTFRSFLQCVILFYTLFGSKCLWNSHMHARQTDRQTRCSNLVSGICKGKIYVSLLSKCQSQEILPYVYSTSLSWCKAALCWIGGGRGAEGERKRQRIRRRNIWIQALLSKQEKKKRNIHRKFYYKFQSILTTFFTLSPRMRSSLKCTRPYLCYAHTQIKCNAYGTSLEVMRQCVAGNRV